MVDGWTTVGLKSNSKQSPDATWIARLQSHEIILVPRGKGNLVLFCLFGRFLKNIYLFGCIGSYGLPWWLSQVKNPPANAGDTGSIPGSGRSPGEGNGNPLQYSCLGSPLDREAWQAKVHGVTQSQT